MLTKEFAQRVELSEKQVRKIVQHLEERGYHLNKTEYRGREATNFQEEDIELFQDIADKVKQTNSYFAFKANCLFMKSLTVKV